MAHRMRMRGCLAGAVRADETEDLAPGDVGVHEQAFPLIGPAKRQPRNQPLAHLDPIQQ
jgi:hypothetical protein